MSWRFGLALLALPLLAAMLTAFACLLLIPPVYTAHLSVAVKAPPTRLPLYGALLQSRRMADRVITHFGLQAYWGEPTRQDARERLAGLVRVGSNKGGLLVIEVDAPLPWLAADLAAFHLQELQVLVDTLRTEAAAERRQRLADELREARAGTDEARAALTRSGIDEASLRSAAGYTGAQWAALSNAARQSEARLTSLSQTFTVDSAPYQREAAMLGALRGQLAQLASTRPPATAHYATAWREHQRQESLLRRLRLQDDEFAQQAGKREEALLLVDRASLPERAGRPYALAFIAEAWAGSLGAQLGWRYRRRQTVPSGPAPGLAL